MLPRGPARIGIVASGLAAWGAAYALERGDRWAAPLAVAALAALAALVYFFVAIGRGGRGDLERDFARPLGLSLARSFPSARLEGDVGPARAALAFTEDSGVMGCAVKELALSVPAASLAGVKAVADDSALESRPMSDALLPAFDGPAGWPSRWNFSGRPAGEALEVFSRAPYPGDLEGRGFLLRRIALSEGRLEVSLGAASGALTRARLEELAAAAQRYAAALGA
jgi:hypothetical protein